MFKSCEKCCGCGFTVGFNGPSYKPAETPILPYSPQTSGGGVVVLGTGFPQMPCKKCDGTGYYDPDQLISVPMKSVKDEYWEKS